MPLTFYPYEDDLKKGTVVTLDEKIEVLLEAAERFKAYMSDPANEGKISHLSIPKDLEIAFNWDGLATVLREVHEMQEGSPADRQMKADHLLKLAEVYEVLRASKMQKLEAVRVALVNEASQLRGGA